MLNRKIINRKQFQDDLINMKSMKKIRLFYDIETYQYNEEQGKKEPREYKNWIYSVAISYFYKDDLKILIVPNFYYLFECFRDIYINRKTKPDFELIAHNGNKYDNHYLRRELIYYYNLECYNQYLMNVTPDANNNTLQVKEIRKEDKEKGLILEKRVKSKINLELTFYLFGIKFFTTDNFIKTHTSIKSLGERLERINKLNDDELKTDYDYIKYNKPDDLTDLQAEEYSYKIFNNLSDEELIYIRNDVIILALSCRYYSDIFKGFDYDSITFTRNILDTYNTNELTQFQLLKSYGQGKHKIDLEYTKYSFNNENLYDWLKSFYNGGLNFYNEKYLGKIIDDKVFGMDINSSYPAVMYKELIPTFLNSWGEFDEEKEIDIEAIESIPNSYSLYRITRFTFDKYIINKIESRVIKQLLVKYYNKNDFININSYTLKMINKLTGLKINKLPVLGYTTWDCVPFGSRDILKEYYKIKTQGQNEYKMNMDDLYNIYKTDEKTDYVYTREEIDIAKLNLNGLYGIPALRPYFNIFRYTEKTNDLVNIENGFINSHRNIVFSIFVTSVSVYNLLKPLSYLSASEIDNNFLYCDTDSLYLKKKIVHKIPSEIFDPNNIGFWDIQNEEIDYFYTLNHKKYCYEENGKIIVKAGGIPQDSFNTNMSFKDFVNTQFKDGTIIKTTRSIYNKQGTISLYKGNMLLDIGFTYPTKSLDPVFLLKKDMMFNKIKKELDDNMEDGLYIETNYGSFSITELYPVIHSNSYQDISYYKLKEDYIKSLIKPT